MRPYADVERPSSLPFPDREGFDRPHPETGLPRSLEFLLSNTEEVVAARLRGSLYLQFRPQEEMSDKRSGKTSHRSKRSVTNTSSAMVGGSAGVAENS